MPLSPARPAVTFRAETCAPFDGPGLFRFFADHAIAGVETGTATSYSRSLRLPGGPAAVDFRLDAEDEGPGAGAGPAPGILCTATLAPGTAAAVAADTDALVALTRSLFDLDADSLEIDASLARDPALAPSVRASPGIRLPGTASIEETLFRTLVGQQVSVAAATTVLGRVARELSSEPGLFPTAEEFAARGAAVLRGPANRVAAIIAVAERIADGSVVLDTRMPLADLTAVLVAQRGIGPWTAGYVAMRALGAHDVLLTGDLIMRRSAADLGLPSTEAGLAAHGARWSPWRSYAGLHLWRSIGR